MKENITLVPSTGLIFGALVFILILVFCAGKLSAQVTPQLNSDLKVVAYGDSLVVGVGSTQGNDFVTLLSSRIGIPIANLGSSGLTTRRAVEEVTEVVLNDIDPDLVILVIGGNDVLQGVTSDVMISNLRIVIERIKASGSAVVLAAVHRPTFLTTRESLFRNLARDLEVEYIPNLLIGIVGNPALSSDLVHPNNKGYKLIADRIFPRLQDAINDLPNQNLTVTCSAESGAINTNKSVKWRAYATGGNGEYKYIWSGTDDLKGSSSNISKTYKTAGQKIATVKVVSNGITVTQDCTGSVNVTEPVMLASCNVSINNTRDGFRVRFNAKTQNVKSRDTIYSWSGNDGLTGDRSSITKNYITAGLKTGTVNIRNGSQNLTLTCSALLEQVATESRTRTSTISCSSSNSSRGVVWRSNGLFRYTHSWTGTDDLTGTSSKIIKQYQTGGLKTANVAVSRDGIAGRLSCQSFV